MKEPDYIACRTHRQQSKYLSRIRFPQTRCILDMAIHKLKPSPHEFIVDIGCGTGENDVYLANNIHVGIVGLDIDRGAVRLAQSVVHNLKMRQLLFVRASATHLPLRENSIDFALCQEVIEHLEKPNVILSEICRILRSRAYLLITAPVKNFSPMSWDWFEVKIRGRLTLDDYSEHQHRFEPHLLTGHILCSGLQVTQMRFTSQYLTPFICFIISLWNRRRLGKRECRSLPTSHSTVQTVHAFESLTDAIIMVLYRIEWVFFGRAPFGSDGLLVARKG